ncbi:MAG: HAD-IA family hydrolase [Magnetococcales bacterium]|nr:HAD-IA family hydrolase [Magnetococcales bacterium]
MIEIKSCVQPLFDLVIFDCDGTLMDSLEGIWQTVNLAMQAQNLGKRFDRHEVAEIVGLSLETAFSHLLPRANSELCRTMALAYKEEFRKSTLTGMPEAPLFPGVETTIKQLHQAGLVLGVATGKSLAGLQRSLRAHCLEPYFTFCQTADSAPSKPHPAMITHILDQSGLSPDRTLMVGDTDFDIIMGRNAGVKTCAVTFGCHNKMRLEKAMPDYWIDQMTELPVILGY